MTTILVIEDERELRNNILKMLTFEGFEAIGAENGEEGIASAFESDPDLIICDVMMPYVDGHQVLSTLRDEPKTRLTPFIFLTARAERDDLRLGMELGADDYVTKPFTQEELLSAIETRLRRAQVVAEVRDDLLQKAKMRFANLVSHELRTPLNRISMVNELISDGFASMSEEELRQLLTMLDQGSQRLSRLVEQTVIFTEFETGLMEKEKVLEHALPLQIGDLVAKSIELGRRFAWRNADLCINTDVHYPEAIVLGHEHLLIHALAELIANALSFSPLDAEVRITQDVQDGRVRVGIVDRGPGISPGEVDTALDIFSQVNRERREQQGVGLGLPLARRIITAYDGELVLQPGNGEGIEAAIYLPADQRGG
jgi:two-component system sensor histidine kinase/response regulator